MCNLAGPACLGYRWKGTCSYRKKVSELCWIALSRLHLLHIFDLLFGMIILHSAVLDAVALGAKVAHAKKQVNHGDLVIVILVEEQETEFLFFSRILGNEVVDCLAILVVGALLREVEELEDDVGKAH